MSRARAIVVVAYGGIEFLQESLAPLAGERVVVVDNSSSPVTRDLVVGLGHHYIDAGSNLGFAGGVNLGLRHVAALDTTTDVLLLNPDAHIEPAQIDRLQETLLADAALAAVAPSLVNAEGHRQLTRYPLPSPGQMWRFALGLPPGSRDRDFVIGAALLLRAEALAEVGELDERYFLYGEEVDWQRRALDRGWRVAEVTTTRALHHGGMSSEDDVVRVARVTAGQEAYVHRWYGATASASFRAAGWLAMVLRSRSGTWGGARFQAKCFREGPRRVAPLPPSPRPLTILHLGFGGAVAPDLATAQEAAGHQVTVAADCPAALRALHDATAYDVVHAHGEAALAVACTTGAWHGARVVYSEAEHPSALARAAAALVRRRVDLTVPADEVSGEAYRASSTARNTNIA